MTSRYMRKVLRIWKTTLLTPFLVNQSWLWGLMVYLTLSLEPWSKIHEDHVNKKLWLAVQKRINKVVLREEYRVKVGNFSRFLFWYWLDESLHFPLYNHFKRLENNFVESCSRQPIMTMGVHGLPDFEPGAME
jgi:hypothetical protein